MRYEDASGAFQASGPIANDDADTLSAGQREPATGNLITGEGTQYGSAGADSAVGGRITAIAGKGGEDNSFSGGKLSVAGEHGRLTVDAEGNYSYQSNGNVENVRDRFTYTLADNAGNSDTAALIVEVGKTPAVIKANAQQVVPGPDGVVTLPPGVELSDVHVVGRNLVVDLPDGTQLVIIDGAIFVPQLVLGGVEVPATNVAALLIGQEVQPAAGETPPSSGGNFALPPPPLDPGIPLGDLIPPTVYDYVPPDPQEVFDTLDEDPEAGTVSAQLDDDALEGGIAGGSGDDPDSVNVDGFLPGSDGDGDLTWSLLLTGAPDGFTYVDGPGESILIQQGGVTVLTVSVDPITGEYSVVQNAPIDHPVGGSENNVDFTIEYLVTDEDGDTATGTLNINVDDDTPTVDVAVASDANVLLTTQDAETDGDPTDTDTATTTADFGGIFSASSAFGADGAGTSSLSYALSTTGGASGLTQQGTAINLYLVGGVVVGSTAASAGAVNAANTVFDISVDADGVVTVNQYSQIDHSNTDPSPTGPGYDDHLISLPDGSVTLTLNGSITDSDGDTVTDSASVGIGANIRFADDGPTIDPTLNQVGGAIVDESEPVEAATIPLVGGYTAGDDPHLAGGLAIGRGSTSGPVIDANAAFGADGPAAGGGITYALDVLNVVSGLTTTEGTAINLVELANGVVVGVVDGTTTVAFAVAIDANTGVVTVEQYLSLTHPDSPDNFDEPVFLDEGSLGVTVTARDFDGDSVTSDAVDITSLIRFEDDGPSIDPALNADATVTVDESLPSGEPGINTGGIVKGNDPDVGGGIALGQGNSGVAVVNANAVFGADGPAAEGSIVYALSITDVDSGVTLTDGSTITLQMVGGVIVGVVDSGPFDGQAAFAIAINPATGVVTVEQYLSLDHPVETDPNDPLGLGDNTVAVNVTATDGDGDQIESDDVDISGQITFLDDGPAVTPTLGTDAAAAVDESPPVAVATIDTGPYAKGDDPDLVGGLAIGSGTTTLLDATAVFGADGPGAEGGLTFQLAVINPSSGLTLTDGSAINLVLLPSGVVVGVVQAGAFAGQAAFAISIDPATGVATAELYLSLDHPVNPDPNDILTLAPGSLGATVTATDGDGDTATSAVLDVSGRINFLDDGPSVDPVLDAEATVTVDESLPSADPAINTGAIVKGNDPDLSGGLAIGQANSGVAIVDANAVFGADGAAAGGGIGYALSITNVSSGVTLTDGSAINLQLVGGVVVGVVASGAFAGQAAFAIAINPATGVVTVEQYLSLDHPVNPNPNDPLGLGDNTVGVTVTATDGDGDPITSGAIDISNNITFLDDGPAVDPELNADATVTVDESLPSTAAGINTGGIAKGDDPDLAGGLALGQANSGVAIVDANAVFGADGPAAGGGLGYALSITSANPGVTLTDGTTITMQLVGGVIVGVVDAGPLAGQAAFAIAIDPTTGVVTVEQYLSLDHPVNPNPNDPLGLGENTVGVTVTATDGDGDPVTSGAVDISDQITFLDDGPAVSPTLNAQATVTVDESLPSNDPAINTGAIVKGNDPDLAGGLALGQANSGVAIVNANAVFGADGPAGGGGISYALSLGVNDTPLTLTDGSTITLQLVGGVVVGVVDNGPFAGQAAFAIAINASTGVVSVEQYLSLDHPLNPNPNDPLGIGANSVGVTVTATDGDGDPVTSGAVDISGQITFLDDGPAVAPTLNANATVTVDESLPSNDPGINTGAIVKGNDPDLPGGLAIGQGNSGGAVVNANAVFGADGPAAGGGISYALALGANDTPLTLTDGSTISLQLVGGVVVGVVDNGPFAGQAAFAIAINPATGVVTVEQYLSLDHPINPDPNDALGLGPSTVGVTVTATDGDGDPVTSGAVDISNQITFLDDGPNAAVNTGAPLDTLVLDETTPPGTETDGDSNPAGLVSVTANFADNFVAPINYGADGPGTTSYSLVLSGPNVNSGLYAVDPADISAGDGDGIGRGAQIVLNQSGNTVTGSVGGVDYFTISIDQNTGVVTFTQLDNIWHANTGSDDDTSALMASIGSLLVRQTVVDGDGDPDTADVDVSQGVFQIEDDGPVATNDVDDIASGGDTAVGNVITGVGTNAGAANADDVGADTPGRVTSITGFEGTDSTFTAGLLEIDGEYGTLTIAANGSYTYTRFDGAPGSVQDVFTYTLIDADGDTDQGTLTINIGNATPNLPDPPLVRLDDDVIPGEGGNPDGPGDDDPDAVPGNVVNGQLDGTGGDGDLTYNFTGINSLPAGFSIDPASTASTLLINQGGTLVMTITLNNDTGAFTVTQNNPISHLPDNAGPENDIENNFPFSIGVEVEDADGDVEPATISINVDDDTPVLSNVQAGDDVTLDETSAGTPAGFPISNTSDTAVITATQAFGADGPAAVGSVAYGLAIVGGSPEPSGLFTAVGNFPITLVAIDGDTVQGQYTNGGTQVAFTIQMNANGTVTLTQNVPLEHNVDGAPGAPHNDALDLTGLINATITITDSDGDSTTASAPIGDNLVFLDDGPDAQADGQAALDQLVLDETRPLGTETDGDSNPAGLATVQANFANNFIGPVDYGADGAGTTSYSLSLSGNGIGSGLYALDPTDTETVNDGFGQGAEITLSINPAGTLITGSAGGLDYFTISIDPTSGVVTFTQIRNVWHSDTANDDDTSSLMTAAASNVQVIQRVTDSDGDFDTASVNIGQGVFHIEDDGPEFTNVDAVLNIDNDADPVGTGDLAFDLGSDGPSSNNNVISLSNFNVAVNGVPLDPSDFALVEGAETATTASYSFSFSYDTGTGGTATANGTLVFDKVAGTYTVDLDGPVEGFSILQTATGTLFQGYELGTSNPDGSQPAISVTQIQGTPGDPDPSDLFLQFTGVSEPSSGTGDNNLELTSWVPGANNPPPVNSGGDTSFNAGDLFNQADGWVSTSNTANGVDGDTIQGGEVLDFTLVQGANPTGVLAQPESYGQATSMFLKFDGIGSGEDMIVVLKLYDPNTDTFTTRAVMVQNADIQKGPGTGPGMYSGVTLDQNDGLVIIESNDYNLPGENWVIVGAQIAGSDEGVTGTAINLNSAIGAAGDSDANNDGSLDTQAFSTDTNDGPFKISSIGFVSENIEEQSATIDFDVTITEADGDSETQHVTVNVGDPPAVTLAAESSAQMQSFSKVAANDDTSSLFAEGGTQKWGGSGFGNVGNTGITSAMVAASGLAAMSMTSLNSFDQPSFDTMVQDSFQQLSTQMVGRDGLDEGLAGISLGAELDGAMADAVNLSSSGFRFGDLGFGGGSLDAISSGDAGPAYAPTYASGEPAVASVAAFAANVPAVSMASAEMLSAAGLEGNVQQGGSVEQVLADALGSGAPTIDAVLANLPGGIGGLAAIAEVASMNGTGVPAWDMGMQGGFAPMHDMVMKVAAVAVHHDAVQPA